MAKPYSNDLRARVIASIEEGATREEAAERHHVSLSSVGRFLRRKRETGSVSEAQFGGYKPYALPRMRTSLGSCWHSSQMSRWRNSKPHWRSEGSRLVKHRSFASCVICS